MKTSRYITPLTLKKIVTLLFIIMSFAAFATLGDGGKKSHQRTLLSSKSYTYDFKTFTLKSGYNYRGNTVVSNSTTNNKYIMLNTVITYQKGNNTYILPLKKKVLLDKVNFNSS